MFDMVSEKLISILEESLVWMFESFISPFADLRMLTTLIFGKDSKFSSVWGTFRPDELSLALGPVYYTVFTLAGIVFLSLIVVNGARISGAGVNPQTRNVLTDFLKDLLFVTIVLFNLPLIYDLLFAINMNIVNLFSSAYKNTQLTKFSSSFEDMKSAAGSAWGVLGLIFIYLILLGLTIWANLYYLMRKVTLVILMALGPLMAVMWLLPQFKPLTGAWFKELVGSIFVQAIHAFVFFTVATMSSADKSFLGTVMVYVLFIPITESLRRLLSVGGDMQGGLNKTAAMFGMAGLAGMAGSIKGALQDKSVMGALKETYQGTANAMKGKGGAEGEAGADSLKNTLGANPGSDIGSDTKAEKMLRTGDIFSKGGKAVLGMAGSIAGMPLGPVGAMAGATAGFTVGGALGGVGGRAGAAMVQGIGNRLAKGKEAAMALKQGEDEDELATSIADTETANWAKENKDSVMADLKERFPNATPADLEKKFNGIQKEKHAGFYQAAQANFRTADANAKNDALGKDLANSSAMALADKWGEENQQNFMEQYDRTNPQKPGESDNAYQTRRMNAFNDKKADMRKMFHNAGLQALDGKGLDEPMSKDTFIAGLKSQLGAVDGLDPSTDYAAVATKAVNGLPGMKLLSQNGKPNIPYLASGMANAAVKQQKDAFVADQMKQGISESDAINDFDTNHAKPAYQKALSTYNESLNNLSDVKALTKPMNGNAQIPKLASRMANVAVGQQKQAFIDNQVGQGVSQVEAENNWNTNHAQPAYKQALQSFSHSLNDLSDQKALSNPLNGKPNIPKLASQMATVAVGRQKDAFIANQVSQGVSATDASDNWSANHAQPAYARSLETYSNSLSNMSDLNDIVKAPNALSNIGKNVGHRAMQAGAFAGAASGVTGFAQGVSNFANATSQGTAAAGSKLVSSMYGQEQGNYISNGVKAIVPSLQEGHSVATQALAEAKGGAVNAQADYSNNVGYGAAILGGTTGYRVGKSIASKFTPYKNAVQNEISSPSEVMQMAQTIIDDRGHTQIAPGAVRQVITPDESYIEVKTNSGENQIVSRKGAGHPGLRQGEAVYQDLQMQNDALVVSKPNGMQTSTYRLDSGGGRIPSNVAVQQNPNTLLGSPQQGTRHRPVQKQNVPLYNQSVDAGQFYVEDIAQAKMSNVQVVVEKDRQYVTAQKDGSTYRVSPVYSGDSRLGSSESRTIPMVVKNGTLKPNLSAVSNVAVQAAVNGGAEVEDYYTSKSLGGMVGSQQLEEMMPGKQFERIQRTQLKRAELDAVRRKQGILG